MAPEERRHPGPPADLFELSDTPRGRWKLKPRSFANRKKRLEPDLGPITPETLRWFERALQGKKALKKMIQSYAVKPHPSIHDLVALAFLRNELFFVEPARDLRRSIDLWRYWRVHNVEFETYNTRHAELLSYLYPPDKIREDSERTKDIMRAWVSPEDTLAFLALWPIIDGLFEQRPGRPVTRRLIAVGGLQMKIDTNWSWTRITEELCDCPKLEHDVYCKENLRQSVKALRELLGSHGIEVPQA